MLFLNRAQESFTTTGLGTLTVGGAPTGWRTLAAALLADYALSGAVTRVAYFCVNSDESIWEFGYGTFDTAAGTMTRNLIASSTGALINWAAGTKYLFSTPEAILFSNHLTHFRGATAPAHARAGYTWADTAAGVTDVRFKYYDGADWLALFSIDETNNRVYPLDHAGARIHGPEVDVASAATSDIGAVASDNVRITGSTGPITSLGTGAAGLRRFVRFASTPTLTHHATALILPSGASIVTAAGDRAILKSLGSGNWECVAYQRADGGPLEAPWTDVASAATTDLGAVASRNVRVTGTTTITSFGTAADGVYRRVRFADALTLTHNAASLILPGSANITTAANDTAIFVSLGAGNWLCVSYKKADGTAVVASASGMVPVATLNLAGLSTADFESAALFDATGGADRIIFEFIDVVTTTDAQDIYGRIKEGGAYKSGASDYRWGTRFGYDDNTTMTGQNYSGDTKMHVSFLSNVSNVATEPFCALVTFYNPAGTAARKKMRSDVVQTDSALADRVQAGFAYGHYVGTNAALEGVRFLPSGAGTFASGRINAYRVPRPS